MKHQITLVEFIRALQDWSHLTALHCNSMECPVQFSSVQCLVFSVRCLVFCVQCSVFSVRCSVFGAVLCVGGEPACLGWGGMPAPCQLRRVTWGLSLLVSAIVSWPIFLNLINHPHQLFQFLEYPGCVYACTMRTKTGYMSLGPFSS